MNLRSTDLNLLTVFEAVYEERSQVKAAERLGMTQPAVSNALGRLKYIAKDPLFSGKSSLGMQPTPRADEIFQQIHQGLNLIRTGLTEGLHFDPLTSHHHFSLAISYGGGSVVGPALYNTLSREAPNAQLTLYSTDTEKETTTMLREQSVDIVVNYNKYADPRLIQEQIYHQHQPVVIARKDHPRIQEKFSLEDTLKERFAMVSGPLPHVNIIHPELEKWFDHVNERIMLHVPNVMVLLSAVAQTDLLGFTSHQFARSFINRFDIKSYAIPWQVERIPLYMIWHRAYQLDPAHKWFKEKVKDTIQNIWVPPFDEREQEKNRGLFTRILAT